MRIERLDDLGDLVPLTQPVRRVVSLSPSLTEVVLSVEPTLLLGATTEFVSPARPDLRDVGDPLRPDLKLVSQLVPDLVLASQEENRLEDVRRLRDAGVSVWTSQVESLPQAFHAVERLVTEALGHPMPSWWKDARRRLGSQTGASSAVVRQRAVVAVATDPWTVAGRSHMLTDLLALHGVENVMASHRDHTSVTTPAEIEAHHVDVVLVLDDLDASATGLSGPDLESLSRQFERTPVRGLDRRLLTRFGPTLLEAPTLLAKAFPHSTHTR